eukprot:5908594-Lingulodinium_polyedra.AAC.1
MASFAINKYTEAGACVLAQYWAVKQEFFYTLWQEAGSDWNYDFTAKDTDSMPGLEGVLEALDDFPINDVVWKRQKETQEKDPRRVR